MTWRRGCRQWGRGSFLQGGATWREAYWKLTTVFAGLLAWGVPWWPRSSRAKRIAPVSFFGSSKPFAVSTPSILTVMWGRRERAGTDLTIPSATDQNTTVLLPGLGNTVISIKTAISQTESIQRSSHKLRQSERGQFLRPTNPKHKALNMIPLKNICT